MHIAVRALRAKNCKAYSQRVETQLQYINALRTKRICFI